MKEGTDLKEGKGVKKHNLANMTAMYLLVIAVISVVLIMGAYCGVQIKTTTREGIYRIDQFENTCKFMLSKAEDTSEDFKDDIDISERLISSASAVSDTDIKAEKYLKPADESEEERLINEAVDYQAALDNLADADACDYLSFIDDGNGDYIVTAATRGYKECNNASELGLADIISKTEDSGFRIAKVNGKTNIVICSKSFDSDFETDDAAVLLKPLQDTVLRSLVLTVSLAFVILSICITLAVWLISLFRRLVGKSLSTVQAERYTYEKVKRKLTYILVGCTLIAFTAAAFSMSLDSAFLQTSRSSKTLKALFERLDDDKERTEIQWEDSQKRYIENAELLARLIDDNRELQNEKWLKEASEIIGADYIMIFDADGDEIISDSPYRGISLKNRENPEMADFARLMKGVRSISHSGVQDEITGLKRDYHGIVLNYLADKDSYGAMLIAVDPENKNTVKFGDENIVMKSMAPSNGVIFEADSKTGSIKHSGKEELIGKQIKKSELEDSYLGDIKTGGNEYFALSDSKDESLYYYCVSKAALLNYVLPFTLFYTLLFAICVGLLALRLIENHPEKVSGTKEGDLLSTETIDSVTAFTQKLAEKNFRLLKISEHTAHGTEKAFDQKVTAEKEAFSILELLIFLFTISSAVIVFIRSKTSSGAGTALEFIASGKWIHGINLISFAAVFYLLCGLFVILALLKVIYVFLSNILGKRALTVSSLASNILFYAAIAVFILLSLSCLGVNTKALFASAGFIGLAVSMSFRDILTDVLAGIMIITGRTYEVGDFIEIKDGGSGTVKNIGLRKTELISENGKVFSIRNSRITRVINHSREAFIKQSDAEKNKTKKKK